MCNNKIKMYGHASQHCVIVLSCIGLVNHPSSYSKTDSDQSSVFAEKCYLPYSKFENVNKLKLK